MHKVRDRFDAEAHVAWRFAARSVQDGNESALANIGDIYHTLRPHPALRYRIQQKPGSVDGLAQDNQYRQLLAEGILAVLLPVEDLQNPCLSALVTDIFADLILGNLIGDRLSAPLQLYDLLTKGVELFHLRLGLPSWIRPSYEFEQHKAYVGEDSLAPEPRTNATIYSWGFLRRLFGHMAGMTASLIAFLGLAQTCTMLFLSSPYLSRRKGSELCSLDIGNATVRQGDHAVYQTNTSLSTAGKDARAMRPIVSLYMWSTVARWIRIDDRCSWLHDLACLLKSFTLHGPGRVGCANAPLDR